MEEAAGPRTAYEADRAVEAIRMVRTAEKFVTAAVILGMIAFGAVLPVTPPRRRHLRMTICPPIRQLVLPDGTFTPDRTPNRGTMITATSKTPCRRPGVPVCSRGTLTRGARPAAQADAQGRSGVVTVRADRPAPRDQLEPGAELSDVSCPARRRYSALRR